jgi:hypothetical protein
MEKTFNPKSKSFKNTFCIFEERQLTEIENLELNYESKSGSKYFYTSDGMYRLSNHWGRLANSKWRLKASKLFVSDNKFKLGFAPFLYFLPDNNVDKLYYLEYNFDDKNINYQHKLNPNFDKKAVLRTTLETTKRIKQARNILNLTNWAKYFEYENLDDLRIKIINELIFTEKSLEQIKKEIYGTQ